MPDDTKTMRHGEASEKNKAWETTCTALLEGNQQAFTEWLYGARVLSEGISELTLARWQLAMEMWSAFAACRTPEEIIDCHRRLMGKTMEHCAGEVTKLSQLTMAFVRPAG